VSFRRSAVLEELVERWLVKVAVLVSVYVTFRGHNAPGGGFAGGLIAGSAFVLQHLTGRPLRIRGRIVEHPARVLGVGLLVAVVTALVPVVIGESALESHIWKLSIPVIGDVKLVSSTFFDVGVYLVVVGVILMILLSLGNDGARVMHDDGESVA
jgi:multisubunit Na+/H+ antiporter MnhB subunit